MVLLRSRIVTKEKAHVPKGRAPDVNNKSVRGIFVPPAPTCHHRHTSCRPGPTPTFANVHLLTKSVDLVALIASPYPG